MRTQLAMRLYSNLRSPDQYLTITKDGEIFVKFIAIMFFIFFAFSCQTASAEQAKDQLTSSTISSPLMDYSAIPKVVKIGEIVQGWEKIGHRINGGNGAAIDAYVQNDSIKKTSNGGQANIAIVTQHNVPDPLAIPNASAISYLNYSYNCNLEQSFYTAWDDRTTTNAIISSGRKIGDVIKARGNLDEPVYLKLCKGQPLPTPDSEYHDRIIFNNIQEFREGNKLTTKKFDDGSEWLLISNLSKDENGNDYTPFVRIDTLSPPKQNVATITVLRMYPGLVRVGKIPNAARVIYTVKIRCNDMTGIYSRFLIIGINSAILQDGPPENNAWREIGPGKWYPVNKIADLVCQ
jgi:hypothetical protein